MKSFCLLVGRFGDCIVDEIESPPRSCTDWLLKGATVYCPGQQRLEGPPPLRRRTIYTHMLQLGLDARSAQSPRRACAAGVVCIHTLY